MAQSWRVVNTGRRETQGHASRGEFVPRIEGIFERFVPVPDAVSVDRQVWEFLDEVKAVVTKAVDEIKQEIAVAGGADPGTTT